MDNFPYIEIYKQFCLEATNNESVFETFRQNEKYTPMLEHVTYYQGQQYLDIINQRPIKKDLIKFKDNDKYGSPKMFEYSDIGYFSPTTLRYIKVLSDMIEMYDTLNGENIIELGGGYGGQCKVISTIFNYKSYTIVDLPEVIGLINKYLKLNNVPNANAITLHELSDDCSYNLFISNYAFTELPKDLQQIYIDKVINKSEHGYITCNFISEDCGITSMGKNEFLDKLIHKYHILDEVPNTHPKNFLLVW